MHIRGQVLKREKSENIVLLDYKIPFSRPDNHIKGTSRHSEEQKLPGML
jgi:hypothetical protein